VAIHRAVGEVSVAAIDCELSYSGQQSLGLADTVGEAAQMDPVVAKRDLYLYLVILHVFHMLKRVSADAAMKASLMVPPYFRVSSRGNSAM